MLRLANFGQFFLLFHYEERAQCHFEGALALGKRAPMFFHDNFIRGSVRLPDAEIAWIMAWGTYFTLVYFHFDNVKLFNIFILIVKTGNLSLNV